MLKPLPPSLRSSIGISLVIVWNVILTQTQCEPARQKYYQARGIISDKAGKPIDGATVYILNQYHSSMRINEKTIEVSTDENGMYLADELRRSRWGGITTIIAVKNRKPAAFRRAAFFAPTPKWLGAWTSANIEGVLAASNTISSQDRIEPGYYGDLVIPDDGATVRVTVLHHVNPAVGVWVRMGLAGTGSSIAPGLAWALRRRTR